MKQPFKKNIIPKTAPILAIIFVLAMLISGGHYVWALIPGADPWSSVANGVQVKTPLTAAKWDGLVNQVAMLSNSAIDYSYCINVYANIGNIEHQGSGYLFQDIALAFDGRHASGGITTHYSCPDNYAMTQFHFRDQNDRHTDSYITCCQTEIRYPGCFYVYRDPENLVGLGNEGMALSCPAGYLMTKFHFRDSGNHHRESSVECCQY
jgi:hypothetical protein